MADLEETLLIIDADMEFASHLAEFLGAQGFHVEVSAAVDQCPQAFQSISPDLVVGDLEAHQIQQLMQSSLYMHSTPPLVVLSKNIASEAILTALREGAADYIAKIDIQYDQVLGSIERLLKSVRLQRENHLIRQELESANKELRAGLEELQADQRAGRHIQMKMLPDKDLALQNIHFDHCIKPSLYLSGDFLEYFRVSETKVAFYFADVSGHGASSAFITVLLKNLSNRLQRNLRRRSSDDVLHPDQFLNRVNKELIENGLGKHLTMFAGLIDVAERKLTYSIGAHFPMPILTEHGHSRFLEGKGPPVGLFEEPSFPVYETNLEEGFSLVLCSDGLLEVISAKSLVEKERKLLETVEGASHTIKGLESAFGIDWIKELPDDVAILVVDESSTPEAMV